MNDNTQFKVVDLFAGAGGFSLGFRLAGFRIISQVEKNEDCQDTLKSNFPEVEDEFRIRDVLDSEFTSKLQKLKDKYHKIDVLLAGPPCQGFSIAGVSWVTSSRKKEYQSLFKVVVTAVEILDPEYVIVENVPNILQIDNVLQLGHVLSDLKKKEYNIYPDIPKSLDFDSFDQFHSTLNNIYNSLLKNGVKTNKEYLSDPSKMVELLELIKINNLISNRKNFEYKLSYIKQYISVLELIPEDLRINEISKIRIDYPQRISLYLSKIINSSQLETENQELVSKITSYLNETDLNELKTISKELVLELDNLGINLDNFTLNNVSKLSQTIKTGIILGWIEKENLSFIHDYNNFLTKVETWAKKIKNEIKIDLKYLVPQKRKRVIAIASKTKDINLDCLKNYDKSQKRTLNEIITDLPELLPGEGEDGLIKNNYRHMNEQNAYLDFIKEESLGIANHRARSISDPMYFFRFFYLIEGSNDLFLPFFAQKLDKIDFLESWMRLDRNKPSKTIVAHLEKDGNSYIHPIEPRSITVREAARIQGFPDNFIFPGNNKIGPHFKQIGNAVPVLLAYNLAKYINVLENNTLNTVITQKASNSENEILNFREKSENDEYKSFKGNKSDSCGFYKDKIFSKEDIEEWLQIIKDFKLFDYKTEDINDGQVLLKLKVFKNTNTQITFKENVQNDLLTILELKDEKDEKIGLISFLGEGRNFWQLYLNDSTPISLMNEIYIQVKNKYNKNNNIELNLDLMNNIKYRSKDFRKLIFKLKFLKKFEAFDEKTSFKDNQMSLYDFLDRDPVDINDLFFKIKSSITYYLKTEIRFNLLFIENDSKDLMSIIIFGFSIQKFNKFDIRIVPFYEIWIASNSKFQKTINGKLKQIVQSFKSKDYYDLDSRRRLESFVNDLLNYSYLKEDTNTFESIGTDLLKYENVFQQEQNIITLENLFSIIANTKERMDSLFKIYKVQSIEIRNKILFFGHKILSKTDVGLAKTHQGGVLITKNLKDIFPPLEENEENTYLDVEILDLSLNNQIINNKARYTYYYKKNEYRISPLQINDKVKSYIAKNLDVYIQFARFEDNQNENNTISEIYINYSIFENDNKNFIKKIERFTK